MGLGDEIMAAGQAQALHRSTGRRVVITDAQGWVRDSLVWKHLDAILRPDETRGGAVALVNAPEHRPYIERWETAHGAPRAVFGTWRAADHPAALALSGSEKERGRQIAASLGRYVVLEPLVKASASRNKQWAPARYEALARLLAREFTVVQLGDARARATSMRLPASVWVETPTFRDAMAALAGAACFVGPEGGLHHAAAGLRVPAVVLFGHFASARATGYDWQVNLGGEAGCGCWARCAVCRDWLDRLAPETVAAAVPQALARARDHWKTEGGAWAL
jgi:ADP-heptose:LPS heptosyltransferase